MVLVSIVKSSVLSRGANRSGWLPGVVAGSVAGMGAAGMTGAATETVATDVKPNRDGVPSIRGGGSAAVVEIVEFVVGAVTPQLRTQKDDASYSSAIGGRTSGHRSISFILIRNIICP